MQGGAVSCTWYRAGRLIGTPSTAVIHVAVDCSAWCPVQSQHAVIFKMVAPTLWGDQRLNMLAAHNKMVYAAKHGYGFELVVLRDASAYDFVGRMTLLQSSLLHRISHKASAPETWVLLLDPAVYITNFTTPLHDILAAARSRQGHGFLDMVVLADCDGASASFILARASEPALRLLTRAIKAGSLKALLQQHAGGNHHLHVLEDSKVMGYPADVAAGSPCMPVHQPGGLALNVGHLTSNGTRPELQAIKLVTDEAFSSE